VIVYIEASAAAKLLFREPETSALQKFLNDFVAEAHALVSSALLETELRRAATRGGARQVSATAVLERIDLIDMDRATFASAGLLPDPALRSLDALHVACALRVEAGLFVTYDQRQSSAAEAAGLRVVAPGLPVGSY